MLGAWFMLSFPLTDPASMNLNELVNKGEDYTVWHRDISHPQRAEIYVAN